LLRHRRPWILQAGAPEGVLHAPARVPVAPFGRRPRNDDWPGNGQRQVIRPQQFTTAPLGAVVVSGLSSWRRIPSAQTSLKGRALRGNENGAKASFASLHA